METIWIIGAGKFGRLACSRLAGRYRVVLVDASEKQLAKIAQQGVICRNQDGIQYLAEHLFPDTKVDWIVPCLPIHLAWQWCRIKTGNDRLRPEAIDHAITADLPNPFHPEPTHIYVSHADFVCPDDCEEPEAYCTRTKQPRKMPMYSLVKSLSFQEFQPMVIQSHQIAPGVGGIRPKQLFKLLSDIKNGNNRILVCTACKCHGVITGGRVLRRNLDKDGES